MAELAKLLAIDKNLNKYHDDLKIDWQASTVSQKGCNFTRGLIHGTMVGSMPVFSDI